MQDILFRIILYLLIAFVYVTSVVGGSHILSSLFSIPGTIATIIFVLVDDIIYVIILVLIIIWDDKK